MAQDDGLADIDDAAIGVAHQIDARLERKPCQPLGDARATLCCRHLPTMPHAPFYAHSIIAQGLLRAKGCYQLVCEPSRRCRWGASQNLKACCCANASSNVTPRPAASGYRVPCAVEHRLLGKHVVIQRPVLAAGGTRLEPTEIGHRRRQMDRGRRADGPQGIVRHQVDIVRLGPAGDLFRLCQAAQVADVDAGIVGDAPFDVGGKKCHLLDISSPMAKGTSVRRRRAS